jgi:hypothetical protein
MNKFLTLIEEFDPRNTGDPKWKLIDFLKSKGINVSLVRDTDMVYIDTGEDTIAINVSQPEEEAESINAGTGTYEVDQEVENLGNKANSGLRGLAAKAWGTPAQKAKTAVKQRQQVAGQAVDAYKKGTERIQKGLQSVKRSQINPTY